MSSVCDSVVDISIGAVLTEHLRELQFHKSYPSDIVDAHRQCLTRFRRFLNRKGFYFYADVRLEHVDSYLCSVGSSLPTRNEHREILGGMFKFAAEMGCREAPDPARPPRQPRKPEKCEPMRAQMVGELLAGVTDPAQRAMAYLMAYAGLSPEEVRTLRVGDIHLDDSGPYLMVSSKDGTTREIPLCDRLKWALQRYPKLGYTGPADRWLFPGEKDKPITYKILRARFGDWMAHAGLDATGYTIRHLRYSFAVRLLGSTDARTAQQILGHRNIRSILPYLSYVQPAQPSAMKEALQRANDLVERLAIPRGQL